jgi:hypothetical protein
MSLPRQHRGGPEQLRSTFVPVSCSAAATGLDLQWRQALLPKLAGASSRELEALGFKDRAMGCSNQSAARGNQERLCWQLSSPGVGGCMGRRGHLWSAWPGCGGHRSAHDHRGVLSSGARTAPRENQVRLCRRLCSPGVGGCMGRRGQAVVGMEGAVATGEC